LVHYIECSGIFAIFLSLDDGVNRMVILKHGRSHDVAPVT
jgi:hypothetical protein